MGFMLNVGPKSQVHESKISNKMIAAWTNISHIGENIFHRPCYLEVLCCVNQFGLVYEIILGNEFYCYKCYLKIHHEEKSKSYITNVSLLWI